MICLDSASSACIAVTLASALAISCSRRSSSFSISVVIPTFNRLIYLERAIKSVLNQTVDVNEIIIVDDGSNDGTSEFINSNYPDLKYIFQPNRGVSAARNMGIAAAKSNWIAFLDSDDEWVNNKLKEQVTQLELNPEINFCHSNEIWIRNKNQFWLYFFNRCKCCIQINLKILVKHHPFIIKASELGNHFVHNKTGLNTEDGITCVTS